MSDERKIANRKPAYEIVLNALRVGREVTLAGIVVVMEGDEFYEPVTMHDTQTGETEERLRRLDFPMSWFIRECEKISDTDLFILAGETALTRMSLERLRKREKHMESLASNNTTDIK